MKSCSTTASNALADTATPAKASCGGAAWHIELRRLEEGWRAVIEDGDAVRSEASLHELIRWLAAMAAGKDRPARGLR